MPHRLLAAILAALAVLPLRAESTSTLADCLALARRQNPDVLIAAKLVEQARGNVTVAKAGAIPALRADGYIQRRERSLANSGGPNVNRPEDYYFNTSLTQNLYSSGAVRGRIAISKMGEQIALENYRTALDATTLAVKLAFYQVLASQQQVGIRREAVNLLDQQLRDQEGRLKAGTVSSLNVTRAQVSLANERPALFQAENELANARIALAQVLGLKVTAGHPAPEFSLRGSLDGGGGAPDLAGSLAKAKATRAEIRARQLDVDALERQTTVDKAGTRPQVNGFVNYQLFAEPNPSTGRENFSGFTVGLSASWTLFDGLATPGRVRATSARASAARQALRAIEISVESDVRNAYAILQQADATIRSQRENTALAGEALRLAMDNFGAGLATQLDLLQGQIDLTRARLAELSGRYLRVTALARLERAIGSSEPVDPAFSPSK